MRQGLRPNLPKGLIRAVAQQATARPRPGMHLIFDFDGTITERDTIGELVRSAIAWQRGRGRDGRELQAAWDSAVRAYADEHHDYATRYAPPQDERTTVGDEAAYLAGMRPSEERSLDRVGQTGVFAGMTAGDLFRLGAEAVGAGHIRIRRGFAEALALAAQRGWRTDVVSVNWSRDFIRGVLHPHDVAVTANDVDAAGLIRPPRPSYPARVTTSADKLRAVRALTGGRADGVLYFGDSPTDLECLLYGRGIVVAEDREECPLHQVLARVTGAQVPSVGELSRTKSALGWARDFQQVLSSGILDLESVE